MTSLNADLYAGQARPGWIFWLLWFAAAFVGAFIYFVPVGLVHILLGLDRLDDPQRAGEISTELLVFAAVLCGAACGSTIALAQWFVLWTHIKRVGLWVVATIAGYASIGLLLLIGNTLQPGWLKWGATLIISGKMHWLARVLAPGDPSSPGWEAASWSPGAITLLLFGAVLGIAQWLVLRGRVHQAGWWIAISAGSWALAAVLSLPILPWAAFIFALEIPTALAGLGMVWLLRRPVVTAGAST